MPADLTGNYLSSIYQTLLHTTTLVSPVSTYVYDGLGNKTALAVSISAVSIDSLIVNNIPFNFATVSPFSSNVLTYDPVTLGVEMRSFNDLLSTANSAYALSDGIYTTPSVTVSGGVIVSLSANPVQKFGFPALTRYVLTGAYVDSGTASSVFTASIGGSPLLADLTFSPILGDSITYTLKYAASGAWLPANIFKGFFYGQYVYNGATWNLNIS